MLLRTKSVEQRAPPLYRGRLHWWSSCQQSTADYYCVLPRLWLTFHLCQSIWQRTLLRRQPLDPPMRSKFLFLPHRQIKPQYIQLWLRLYILLTLHQLSVMTLYYQSPILCWQLVLLPRQQLQQDLQHLRLPLILRICVRQLFHWRLLPLTLLLLPTFLLLVHLHPSYLHLTWEDLRDSLRQLDTKLMINHTKLVLPKLLLTGILVNSLHD